MAYGRAVAWLLSWSVFAANDWPRFRGPNGTGVSGARNLPVKFDANSNLAWKAPAPSGISSPVVAGDRVIVAGYEAQRRLVVCFDLKTGKRLWLQSLEAQRSERRTPPNDPAPSTPATDGHSVYAYFPDYGLVAYTLQGKERWRTPLGPFNPPHGMSSSPILAGDSVILAADQVTDSFVAAFDSANGRLRWRTARPSLVGGYSTPVVCRDELIVSGPLQLTAYSPSTGERLWSAPNMGALPISVPVCDGDTLYVNNAAVPPFESMAVGLKADRNGDGKLSPEEFPDPAFKEAVLAIDRAYGNGDGAIDAREWDGALKLMQTLNALAALRIRDGQAEERWRTSRNLPDVPSPVLYLNVLYLVKDGGILTSLDPATGQVHKQGRLAGAVDKYFASPVAADGKLFALSESGKVAVVKAAPQWELLAVNDLGEECYATPAIVEGGILIRTKHALYCFRAASRLPVKRQVHRQQPL